MKFLYSAIGAIFFIGVTITILNSSCAKSECGNVVCRNGGVCKTGFCLCSNGWDGPTCKLKMNDKFKGVYYGVFKHSNDPSYNGLMIIEPSVDNNLDLKIKFLMNSSDTIYCVGRARESIQFEILNQVANSKDNNGNIFPLFTMNGESKLEGNNLRVFFQYVTPSDTTISVSFFGIKN